MLDLELTPSDAAKHDRARSAALGAEYEDLLVLLSTLRGASGDALCTLYFDRAVGRAAAYRRLKELVANAVLAHQMLPDARSIYRLTRRALALSPRVRARSTDSARRPLADHDAEYSWLRASVWAELVKAGWVVGRGRDELLAVRRFLVDEQLRRAGTGAAAARVLAALRAEPRLTPLFRARCATCALEGPLGVALSQCPRCRGRVEQVLAERRFECRKCGSVSDRDGPHDMKSRADRRCTAALREADHLAFDVAWRTSGGTREVMLVFVDDPSRDLFDQLRLLPLRIAGQPRVPIILRTTDPSSVFNRAKGTWISKGERHRALLRAFSDAGDKHAFPFATTASVVEPKPELQLRLSPHRREKEIDHA